jgi:hypothetical protein
MMISKEYAMKLGLHYKQTTVSISNSTHETSQPLEGEVKEPLRFVPKRGTDVALEIHAKVYVSAGLAGICDFLIGTPFINACGGHVNPRPVSLYTIPSTSQ